MNISEWSGASTNVSWSTVVKWSVPISLVIILSALILALSRRARMVFERLIDYGWGFVECVVQFIYFIGLPQLLERRLTKMAARSTSKSATETSLRDKRDVRSYARELDYWRRTPSDGPSTEHQIPAQNLRHHASWKQPKRRLTTDLSEMKRSNWKKTTRGDPNV